MRSKTWPVMLIVAGGLLSLGPLWGFPVLVIKGEPASPMQHDYVYAAAMTGLTISPIGFAVLFGGFIWLAVIKNAQAGVHPPFSSYPGFVAQILHILRCVLRDRALPLVTLVQGIWAGWLLCIALFWLSNGREKQGCTLVSVVAVYTISIGYLFRKKRWAWLVCWIIPTISLLLHGPGVVYRFALILANVPLVQDSPAIILFAAKYALLFVLPPLIIICLLFFARRLVFTQKITNESQQET